MTAVPAASDSRASRLPFGPGASNVTKIVRPSLSIIVKARLAAPKE